MAGFYSQKMKKKAKPEISESIWDCKQQNKTNKAIYFHLVFMKWHLKTARQILKYLFRNQNEFQALSSWSRNRTWTMEEYKSELTSYMDTSCAWQCVEAIPPPPFSPHLLQQTLPDWFCDIWGATGNIHWLHNRHTKLATSISNPTDNTTASNWAVLLSAEWLQKQWGQAALEQ